MIYHNDTYGHSGVNVSTIAMLMETILCSRKLNALSSYDVLKYVALQFIHPSVDDKIGSGATFQSEVIEHNNCQMQQVEYIPTLYTQVLRERLYQRLLGDILLISRTFITTASINIIDIIAQNMSLKAFLECFSICRILMDDGKQYFFVKLSYQRHSLTNMCYVLSPIMCTAGAKNLYHIYIISSVLSFLN